MHYHRKIHMLPHVINRRHLNYEFYCNDVQLVQWEAFIVNVDRQKDDTQLWNTLSYRTIIFDMPNGPNIEELDPPASPTEMQELPPTILFLQHYHDLDTTRDIYIWMDRF